MSFNLSWRRLNFHFSKTDSMDNIQIWIYIIFGIIYFIIKGRKKKQQKQGPASSNAAVNSQVEEVPTSFEELVRQITESKEYQSAQEEPEPEEEKPRYKEVKAEPEKPRFSDEESRQVYEKSILAANQEVEEEEPTRLFHPTGDATNKAVGTNKSSIKKLLANSESAKKALILSEILQRKY